MNNPEENKNLLYQDVNEQSTEDEPLALVDEEEQFFTTTKRFGKP